MPVTIGSGLSFCGHALTESELDLIRRITREFANLTVTELAATLCELLEWRPSQWGLEEPRVLPVSAGTAAARMAALVAGSPAEAPARAAGENRNIGSTARHDIGAAR
jgi:hypothetical protein